MTDPEKLNPSLAMSILLHAGLFGVVLFAPALFPMGSAENWGSASAGEGMNVNIVGSLPGMALPAPEVKTEDAAANDSKGFYKSDPAPPTPPPPVEKAVPIADKSAKTSKAPAADKPAAKTAPPAPDIPSNAVPYGKGGNPDVGYGGPTIGSGPVGAGFGDAAFGSKYAGYVDAMKRKISQNWLKGLVDSNQVRGTPRVYMSFDIERDGRIINIEMKQSSNFPSLDNSARRALLASSPLQPLPSDYLGSRVTVTFYFEYVK
jgi:TonB family protein